MTAISINLPDSNTSRDEEIAILEKLVSKIAPTSSYLSSLFSRDLLQWASWQIRNDFPANIMDAYQTVSRQKEEVISQASNDLSRKDRIIKDLEHRVFDAEANLSNAQIELGDHRSTLRDMSIAHNELMELVETLKRQLAEAEDEHRLDIDRLELQVVHLKARIYDLQNPEVTK